MQGNWLPGKCCQLQPIDLSEYEANNLRNGKNNVYRFGDIFRMSWSGKWCGYSDFEKKTCSLGDEKTAMSAKIGGATMHSQKYN